MLGFAGWGANSNRSFGPEVKGGKDLEFCEQPICSWLIDVFPTFCSRNVIAIAEGWKLFCIAAEVVVCQS